MASQRKDGRPEYGITGALNMDGPTPQALELNDKLLAELKEQGTFESPERTEQRYEGLASGPALSFHC